MKRKPIPKPLWFLAITLLLAVAACTPQAATPSPSADTAEGESVTADRPAESSEEVSDTADEATVTENVVAETIDPSKYDEYEIVTLLPPDAIPAIDNPQFLTADEALTEYDPDELVLGVFINGEARAYSVPHLSSHEIVNDTVGGRKISVTW